MASSETLTNKNDTESLRTLFDENEIRQKFKDFSKDTDKLLQNIKTSSTNGRARRKPAVSDRHSDKRKNKNSSASRCNGDDNESDYTETPCNVENKEACIANPCEKFQRSFEKEQELTSTCICEYSPYEKIYYENPDPVRYPDVETICHRQHQGGQSNMTLMVNSSNTKKSSRFKISKQNNVISSEIFLQEHDSVQCGRGAGVIEGSRYSAGESEMECDECDLQHSIRNNYSMEYLKGAFTTCNTFPEMFEKPPDLLENMKKRFREHDNVSTSSKKSWEIEKKAFPRCDEYCDERKLEYKQTSRPEDHYLLCSRRDNELDHEIHNGQFKYDEREGYFQDFYTGLDSDQDIINHLHGEMQSGMTTHKNHKKWFLGAGGIQIGGTEDQSDVSNSEPRKDETRIHHLSTNKRHKNENFSDRSVKGERTMDGANHVHGESEENHKKCHFSKQFQNLQTLSSSYHRQSPDRRHHFEKNKEKSIGSAPNTISSTIIHEVCTAKLIKDSKGTMLHKINVRNAQSIQSFILRPQSNCRSHNDLLRYSAGSLKPLLGAKPSFGRQARLKGHKPQYIKIGITPRSTQNELCQAKTFKPCYLDPRASQKPRNKQTPHKQENLRPCQCGVPLRTECGKKFVHEHECHCRVQQTLYKPAIETSWSNDREAGPLQFDTPHILENVHSVVNSVASKCGSTLQKGELTSDPSTVTLSCYDSGKEAPQEAPSSFYCACLLDVAGSGTATNKVQKRQKEPKTCTEPCGRQLKLNILSALSCSPYTPKVVQSCVSFRENPSKICICPLCGLKHIPEKRYEKSSSPGPHQRNICQNKASLAGCASKFSVKSSYTQTSDQGGAPSKMFVQRCSCQGCKQETQSFKIYNRSQSSSKKTRTLAPPSAKITESNIFFSTGVSSKPSVRSLQYRCEPSRLTRTYESSPQPHKSYTKREQTVLAESGSSRRLQCICSTCELQYAGPEKPSKRQYDSDESSELCRCKTPVYSLSYKSSQNSQSILQNPSVPTIRSSTSAFTEKHVVNTLSKNVCPCAIRPKRYRLDTIDMTRRKSCDDRYGKRVASHPGTRKSDYQARCVCSPRERYESNKKDASIMISMKELHGQKLTIERLSEDKCQKACYESTLGCLCSPMKKPKSDTSSCLYENCKCTEKLLKEYPEWASRCEKPKKFQPDICLCPQKVSPLETDKKNFICLICERNFNPTFTNKGPHSAACDCADCLCSDKFDESQRQYIPTGEVCRTSSVVKFSPKLMEKCPCPDCFKYRVIKGGYHMCDMQPGPLIQLQLSKTRSRSSSKGTRSGSPLSQVSKCRTSRRTSHFRKSRISKNSRQSSRFRYSRQSGRSSKTSRLKQSGDEFRTRESKLTSDRRSQNSKGSDTPAEIQCSESPSKHFSSSPTLLSESEMTGTREKEPQSRRSKSRDSSSKVTKSLQESLSFKCSPICKCSSENESTTANQETVSEKVSSASSVESDIQLKVEELDDHELTDKESTKSGKVESKTVARILSELKEDEAPKLELEKTDAATLPHSKSMFIVAETIAGQTEHIGKLEGGADKYFEVLEDEAFPESEKGIFKENKLKECKEKEDYLPRSECICSLLNDDNEKSNRPCACSERNGPVGFRQVSQTLNSCSCSTQSDSFKDVSELISDISSATELSQVITPPVYSGKDQAETKSHQNAEGTFEEDSLTKYNISGRTGLQQSEQRRRDQSTANNQKVAKDSFKDVHLISNYDALSDHVVPQEQVPAGKPCPLESERKRTDSHRELALAEDLQLEEQFSNSLASKESVEKYGRNFDRSTVDVDSCKHGSLVKTRTNENCSSREVTVEEIKKEISCESGGSLLSGKGDSTEEEKQIKDLTISSTEPSCISALGSYRISTSLTISSIDGGPEILEKAEQANIEKTVENDKPSEADIQQEDGLIGDEEGRMHQETSTGVITGVCPNNCGCPDCPFLTTKPCKGDPSVILQRPLKQESIIKKKLLLPCPTHMSVRHDSNMSCSDALDQIRSIVCGLKTKNHSGNCQCICAIPNVKQPKNPSAQKLPLRRCVCDPAPGNLRNDDGKFELVTLPSSPFATKGNSWIRNASKINDSNRKDASNYEYVENNKLINDDSGLNSLFGFLYTEIKNIKNLLNCGLQKIGVKENPQKCLGPPPPYLQCTPLAKVNPLSPDCCPPSSCCISAITIIGVHSVGSKSLLITWRVNCGVGIIGFEVYVDDCLKSRSFSISRTSAVAYGVDLNRQHTITVAALMDQMFRLPNYSPTEGSFCYQPVTFRRDGVSPFALHR